LCECLNHQNPCATLGSGAKAKTIFSGDGSSRFWKDIGSLLIYLVAMAMVGVYIPEAA
jgi:hypothetical protein